MYLLYKDQSKAQNDLKLIYHNMMFEEVSKNNGKLWNKKTKSKDTPVFIDSETYPKLGISKGKIELYRGYTTAWDVERQDVSGDWYFKKPKDEWMDGLKYYLTSETIEMMLDNTSIKEGVK